MWDLQQSGKDINESYAPIIQSFEEENPGVTVELTVIPYEQYLNKALLALNGSSGPDVLSLDQIWMAQLAAAGQISPLDEQIEASSSIKPDDFFAGAWDSNVYNDETYGIPMNADVWEQLYYNADLFEAAGLDPDEPPTTWDEWNSALEKLTDPSTDQAGISLIGCKNEGSVVVTNSLMFSNGGSVITDNASSYDSPENQAALEQYAKLASFAPTGVAATCEQDAVSRFTAGKAAMLLDGSWQQDTMKTAASFDWRIAVPPAPEGKTFVGALGGFNLGISARADNPDLAFKWIEYLTTPENQVAINSLIPALKTAGADFVQANRQQPEVVLETLENGGTRPATPVYPQVSQAQQDTVQAILGGEDVSKAMADGSKAIEAAISAQ
ncbi:sugar ABC transporter substrate-binding protein [Microbacterium marinum]|uniref:ABC transporter substrate-binding protein n=1 Tax=Microbacterium marinum TaxID=421115 RepID=UPI00384AD89B